MENNQLATVFIKLFQRFGFDSQEENGIITFESQVLRGVVTLRKPFTVIWKEKRGFVVYDLPSARGQSSAQFKNVGDCLDFLRRRILHL